MTDITDEEYERKQVADAIARNGSFLLVRGPLKEKDLAREVLGYLGKYFHVHEQVHGTSRHGTGKRLRMDAVLRPRDPLPWFDENPVFGVEFKRLSSTCYESLNKYTRWIAQAADYTATEWDGYGYLPVFTCPPVTIGCPYLDDTSRFAWARLMGQFDVGELGLIPDLGWTLRMTGENYWTEARGIMPPPRSLIPKEGSGR